MISMWMQAGRRQPDAADAGSGPGRPVHRAEPAGRRHAGTRTAPMRARARARQYPGPNLRAAATPLVIAALIAAHGYPIAFAAAAVLPLIAAALVPVAAVDAFAAVDATARPG